MQRRLNNKPSPNSSAWSRYGFAWAALAFHLLLFAYTWLRIQPALGFERSGPLFFLNHAFFREHLEYPGGLLDYAAAGLAQFNYGSLPGALSFTSLAGLSFLATLFAWRRLVGERVAMVPFVPPYFLLLAHQRSDNQALAIGLGFVLGLGLALVGCRLSGRRTWLRVATCALLGPLICFVAGVWPCLLFLTVTAPWETRRQAWLTGLAALLLGIAMSGVVIGLSGAVPLRVINPWGTGVPLFLASAVYLIAPLAVLAFDLLPRGTGVGTRAASGRGAAQMNTLAGSRIRAAGWRRAAAAGTSVAGLVWVWLAFDGQARTLAEIEYAASRQEHKRVIAAAAGLAALPPAAEVRLHLALCHTGQLLTELFAFTNLATCELLPGVGAGADATRAQAETLFELGQVNEAEHLAHEVLEFEGDRPDLLRMLAHINVLKDRPEAARVFLNVLRQSPPHRAWTAARLRELETDPRLANDRALSLIRSRLVTTDLPHDGMPTATFLDQLLHSNPRNQMALEYLLAHRLLTLDLERFAAKVGQLHDFGYKVLPRHCEEAVLLHQRLRGVDVDLRGCQIRPETRQRFQALCSAIDRGDLRSAEGARALVRNFAGTYWNYYFRRAPENRATTR